MKRFSHFIVLAIKRRIPLRKRKESTLAKLTGRKLRLDPLESRDLLSCVGLANTADTAVQDESFERSNVEYRSNPVVGASQDVDVIYWELGEEPFCGPLPKDAYEAYMRWMQMDCGLSASESDAIIAMHHPDNTSDPVDRVKPVASSQAVIQSYNLDAEVLDGEVTAYTTGSGGSSSGGAGMSGGSGSSGGSTSGGSTSSGGSHEYCSHEPWLCGGLGSSSSGGSSGGSSKPDFYLITNDDDEIELQLYAGDADETSERDENLQLVASNLAIKDQSFTKIGNSYVFTVKIDVSSYEALNGSFKVVDCHGRESASVDVCVRPVKITGFEIQEKAPGATEYESLFNEHVVWKENTNRLYFHTSPQVDYDDAQELRQFESLFKYQMKCKTWTWDSTEKTYLQTNDNWNSFGFQIGVFDLKVELSQNNVVYKTYEDPQRYCVNEVSSITWKKKSETEATESHLDFYEVSNGYKTYVEQPLNVENGELGALQNIASAQISIAIPIPSGLSGSVVFNWYDPDNPIGSEILPNHNHWGRRDNYGSLSYNSNWVFFEGNGSISQFVDVTLNNTHLGDNFILAVHPNSLAFPQSEINGTQVSVITTDSDAEETISQVLKTSPVLTVWRTLWVEQDVAKYHDPDGGVRIASVPVIDSVLQSQFGRACVDVRVYTPNLVSETISDEVLIIHVDGDNLTRDDENISQYVVNRESPLPSDSFWSILAVGAFSCVQTSYLGLHREDHHALFIFDDAIENSSITVTAKRNIMMHELGHALGLEDPSPQNVTISQEGLSMMNPNGLDYVWYFSDQELKVMQRYSQAR